MNCQECNTETINPKFCSRACSAKASNRSPKRKRGTKCESCGDSIIRYRKFCEKCATSDVVYTCKHCNAEIHGTKSRERMFCDSKCRSRMYQYNGYLAQKARANKRKSDLLDRSGNGCYICGYSKNTAALSFHHLNPKDKKFGLDARSLSNRRLTEIESEFAKCVLVCMNCHAEIHHPDCETT